MSLAGQAQSFRLAAAVLLTPAYFAMSKYVSADPRTARTVALALLVLVTFIALKFRWPSTILLFASSAGYLLAAFAGYLPLLLLLQVGCGIAALVCCSIAALEQRRQNSRTGEDDKERPRESPLLRADALAVLARRGTPVLVLTADRILEYTSDGTTRSHALQDTNEIIVTRRLRVGRASLAVPALIMAGLMIWWASLQRDLENAIGAAFPVTLFLLMAVAVVYYARVRVIRVAPDERIEVELSEGLSSRDVEYFAQKVSEQLTSNHRVPK